MRRTLSCLAAVVVLFTGCGDDGSSNSVEDQDTVDRAALTLGDLPEGWGNDDSDDDDSDDTLDLPAECDDLETVVNQDEFEGQTAETASPSFVLGEIGVDPTQVSIDAEVSAATDTDAMSAVFERFRDERLINCLDDAFRTELEEQSEAGGFADVEIGTISVSRPEAPDLGDESADVRIVTTLSLQGVTLPFTADLIAVRKGRFAASVSVTTIGEFPGEHADADVALEAMLARLP